jgi:hypothetical protein
MQAVPYYITDTGILWRVMFFRVIIFLKEHTHNSETEYKPNFGNVGISIL